MKTDAAAGTKLMTDAGLAADKAAFDKVLSDFLKPLTAATKKCVADVQPETDLAEGYACWKRGDKRPACAEKLCCGGGNVDQATDDKNLVEFCQKSDATTVTWKNVTENWKKTKASMKADATSGVEDKDPVSETLKFHCIESGAQYLAAASAAMVAIALMQQ